MENLDILSQDELATIVGATNVHQTLREKTGMCGCGVLPETCHLR